MIFLHQLRIALFLLILLISSLSAQVPPGGVSLNALTGTTWQKTGKGTLTLVNVEGLTFTKALRQTTGTDIAQAWDAQIKFPAVAGIAVNDIILVAFWARTISSIDETGEGYLMVCIEQNTAPHTKQIYYKISMGSEWKQYFASVKSAVSMAPSAINYSFHTGFPSQTIEVADVQILNYKNSLSLNDLPVTEITYPGQDPNAAWRQEAASRIEQHRKGTAELVIYDEQGEVTFSGFLGTYRYTIESGGKKRSGTFNIEHSSHSGKPNRIVLSLDNAIPDNI